MSDDSSRPYGYDPNGPSVPPPAPQPAPPAYGAPTYPGAQPTYPQPYATAPAYGAAPYGAPYPYAAQKTNVLAIVSMIASIAGIIGFLPIIGSVAGVIMGHISLSQLKTRDEKGRGMALAGVIVGYVGLALWVLGIIAFFALIGWASTQGARYGT